MSSSTQEGRQAKDQMASFEFLNTVRVKSSTKHLLADGYVKNKLHVVNNSLLPQVPSSPKQAQWPLVFGQVEV